MSKKIRINKFLAQCGLGSRRKVEELITNNQIKVNNKTIDSFAIEVDPETDRVKCSGKLLTISKIKYYVILNKPKGFITTVTDPFDRPIVMELLPEKYSRAGVFPIGRLDKDTEGLLLLTNDGDLAHKLMHPRFQSTKEYIVTLDKPLEEKHKLRISKGMHLPEFYSSPCSVSYIEKSNKIVKLIISEGKKRQIRLIFRKLKYKVRKLKRIAVGPLIMGSLPSGKCRDLRKQEVKLLKDYVDNTSKK